MNGAVVRSNRRGYGDAALYVVAAFAWSWFWWGMAIVLLRNDVVPDPVAAACSALGDVGPAVAVWWVVARRSTPTDAWRFFRSCLRLPPSGRWTFVGFGALVVAIVAIAASARMSSGEIFESRPSLWLIGPYLLLMLVLGGGQEEFGWRGFLQPWLVGRLSRVTGSLAAGVIWFGWHLPLFAMPGSIQTQVPVGAFAAFTIGFSLLVWKAMEVAQFHASMAIWLHAVNNCAGIFLVFVSSETGTAHTGAWALGGLYLVVGAVALLIPRASSVPQPNSTRIVDH